MKYLFTILFVLVAQLATQAEIKLASIFTDNMVLQQQSSVPVWGWAKAGSSVTLIPSWNNKTYTIKANSNGKWKLQVETPVAGGPFEISISDGTPLKLSNVLIGEVWLCSGQSNMEMPLRGFKSQPILGSNNAILKSKNSNIRIYTVPRSSITTEQENSKPSPWKVAGAESVSSFSATAYYFARLLQEMLNVPVGVINSSYGGSTIEAWMDPETLKPFKDIKVPGKKDSIIEKSRTPTTLYNGMIYPIVGYGIKGCIWYQGESNNGRPDQYEKLFAAMVNQWRTEWGGTQFPFYFAQIAPYTYVTPTSVNQGKKFNSAYLRDAQRKSVAQIPNTDMAVLLDLGEEKSIHPMHKEEGGTRLALLALAKTYGMKGFGYASPELDTTAVDGSILTVKFKNAGNGLTSFGQKLSQFEIAGENKTFYPADAVISGATVLVSSPYVKDPKQVRYAFKDYVVADLFSTEGFPISSFRTDNW
ncbi:sialate O-acetylesterase [Arcticibacter eurypsychrophilus]|uniref:sialate O-acetylesterase n=1 Tax=Arcticibacter eurypsychrophilus TaxID=1434752 RepID=UPI00084D8D65|nr:sialate O-acetylesterase [Arcticibacter eurypsychrophilus]